MSTTCWTGHEADIAATETGPTTGETITIRVRVGGASGTGTLAHPLLPLGQQGDGRIVLAVEAWRRRDQPRADVVANVLATVFLPRAANWLEKGLEDPPEWRVAEDDKRRPSATFGPGQICEYWDGRRA